MATDKNKERMHVAMPPQTRQLVERLQARLGAGTRSETVRRALALLDIVITEQDQGGELYIHAPDGTQTRLRRL